MSEREALLRAVAASPDEDTPRLMYADLLDELGGAANAARARFIRVQIDLARNPGRSWFADSERLCDVSRLAGQFADVWLNELPVWAANEARKQRLRADDFPRGFLSTFHVRPRTFALKGHELLEVAPVRRVVVLGPGAPDDLFALLTTWPVPRIRALSFTRADHIGDAVAGFVQRSPSLGALDELDLSGTALTDAGAARLAQALNLRNLRALSVRKGRLTADGAAALLSAPALPNLQVLNVREVAGCYQWAGHLRARFPKKTLLV